jgi:DNA-binding PadR family transcriptional regulator
LRALFLFWLRLIRVVQKRLDMMTFFSILLFDNEVRYKNLYGIMLRHFFLGFIKIHILHHASEEPIYGLWIIEELGRHGYQLSPGTLYPILHALEADGLLRSSEQLVDGKIRKYYEITSKGRKTLAEVKKKIKELVDEVMPQ